MSNKREVQEADEAHQARLQWALIDENDDTDPLLSGLIVRRLRRIEELVDTLPVHEALYCQQLLTLRFEADQTARTAEARRELAWTLRSDRRPPDMGRMFARTARARGIPIAEVVKAEPIKITPNDEEYERYYRDEAWRCIAWWLLGAGLDGSRFKEWETPFLRSTELSGTSLSEAVRHRIGKIADRILRDGGPL